MEKCKDFLNAYLTVAMKDANDEGFNIMGILASTLTFDPHIVALNCDLELFHWPHLLIPYFAQYCIIMTFRVTSEDGKNVHVITLRLPLVQYGEMRQILGGSTTTPKYGFTFEWWMSRAWNVKRSHSSKASCRRIFLLEALKDLYQEINTLRETYWFGSFLLVVLWWWQNKDWTDPALMHLWTGFSLNLTLHFLSFCFRLNYH